MEYNGEFLSFKKILVFGAEGSGKTSFVQRIEKRYFTEEQPSQESNQNFFNTDIFFNI